MKKAKKDYFQNKFDNCQGDSASTWKTTNGILGNKKKSTNPTLINFDRKDVTDQKEMCKIFNNYFANLGENLASTITGNGLDPLSYLGPRLLNSFNFMCTTPQEVFDIIKKFKNKKSSKNNIPIEVFKKISPIISPLLSQLFNESIEAGIFPDKLKTGRVIPLHKEDDRTCIKTIDQLAHFQYTLKFLKNLFTKE